MGENKKKKKGTLLSSAGEATTVSRWTLKRFLFWNCLISLIFLIVISDKLLSLAVVALDSKEVITTALQFGNFGVLGDQRWFLYYTLLVREDLKQRIAAKILLWILLIHLEKNY